MKTAAKLMNIVLESAYLKTLTTNDCEYVCGTLDLSDDGSGVSPF